MVLWLPDREGHKFGLVVKLGSWAGNRSALTSWFGGFFLVEQGRCIII